MDFFFFSLFTTIAGSATENTNLTQYHQYSMLVYSCTAGRPVHYKPTWFKAKHEVYPACFVPDLPQDYLIKVRNWIIIVASAWLAQLYKNSKIDNSTKSATICKFQMHQPANMQNPTESICRGTTCLGRPKPIGSDLWKEEVIFGQGLSWSMEKVYLDNDTSGTGRNKTLISTWIYLTKELLTTLI